MTKKQRQLLQFITRFYTQNGYSPSYREIMTSLGYKSVSTVATHVDNLILLGALRKTNHSARSLEVVEAPFKQTLAAAMGAKPTQQKWLIDLVAQRFLMVEKTQPSNKQIDDLFVLVGALSVLGFTEAAIRFKSKLKDYE